MRVTVYYSILSCVLSVLLQEMASSDVVSLPALHKACRDGDSTTLGVLINSSIAGRLELFHRICECDSYLGWTPAHWAAYHGKVSFVYKQTVFINIKCTFIKYKHRDS